MTLITFLVATLALWLSVSTLKIALGRTSAPKLLKPLSRSAFALLSLTFSALGLWCLCQYLPSLQAVFAWLGVISVCGMSSVIANPSLRSSQ